jgi:hypothetical protein
VPVLASSAALLLLRLLPETAVSSTSIAVAAVGAPAPRGVIIGSIAASCSGFAVSGLMRGV